MKKERFMQECRFCGKKFDIEEGCYCCCSKKCYAKLESLAETNRSDGLCYCGQELFKHKGKTYALCSYHLKENTRTLGKADKLLKIAEDDDEQKESHNTKD